MPSKLNASNAARNLGLDAKWSTAIGNAGVLFLYDNTAAQPAGPGSAVPGGSVLLAQWTLGSPFAPAASGGGPLAPTIPADVNALNNGTPGWWRLTKADGTTGVWDGSAGASGTDMIVTGAIVAGQPVRITSWTVTDTNSGH